MFTLGGEPVKNAWTWSHENQQRLGECVVGLLSENRDERRRALIAFYELRRHFVEATWDKQMNALEAHRKEKGAKSVADLLEIARFEMTGIPSSKPKESTMDGLTKFCDGIRLAGEGLIAIANEIQSKSAAVAPTSAPQPAAPAPEPEKKAERKTKAPAPTPAPEAPQEQQVAPDYAAIKAECLKLIPQAYAKDAARVVETLKKFGAAKVQLIADENLAETKKIFEEIINS